MRADINYPPGEFANITRGYYGGLILEPPSGGIDFDDLLKLSNTSDTSFINCEVRGGMNRENALDVNNRSCRNIFRACAFDMGQGPSIYVKGGSCNNIFDDILLRGVARSHSDLYVGDYSDQSKEKSLGNTFNNMRREDGKPVRVSWNMLRAEKPIIANSKVTYQYGWSLVRTIVVELKYLLT